MEPPRGGAGSLAFLAPCVPARVGPCVLSPCARRAPTVRVALRRARALPARMSSRGGDERDERGDAESDASEPSVDWNDAWASFRGGGMLSDAPAGREAVTPRELAARRAAARVRSSVQNAASRVPSRQALFRDWRFWVAIIFALSLFSAYVSSTAPTASPPPLGGGSGVV